MTATPRLTSNHALDQFQKYLMTHNKSPNTICVYRYAVEQFYHLYPQLTPRNLQLYKVYLLEHYRPQTVNLRIRALNCYMEYRQASITPVSMIKIQQKTYLDKIISQADYEYLKRCLAESEEYTYYFIVRLITATGVRISELITFQIEDVHTGHKDIYSKGNKMRRVYIPRGLVRELQEWLAATHRSTGPCSSTAFTPPSPRQAYGPSSRYLQPGTAWTPRWCIPIASGTVLPRILLKNAGIYPFYPTCWDMRALKPPVFTSGAAAVNNTV